MSIATTNAGSHHKTKQLKVGVIFIGRRRPGFDMEWGRQMEEKVRAWLRVSGCATFEPAEKTVDDNTMRQAVAACEAQAVDAIVVLQTTMGDGRLALTLAQLWPDPVVFWATPEKQEGDMISSCSLVGAHCWAAAFRQLGHSFDVVYGTPESKETQTRFLEGVKMAATVRRLRKVRMGMIGLQAPGFFTMSADPFSLYRGLGVQLQNFSLLEFSNAFNDLDAKCVSEDVAKVKAMGIPYKDVTDEDLPIASKYYLALRSFFDNENLDAMTIRCWPEMPNTFGQWPYLAVARLIDEGRPLAIEGDADGALLSWMGESLGLGPSYLTDWLEHDDKTITTWHGGAAPMAMSPAFGQPGGPKLTRHFNIKKPMCVESSMRVGMPVTVARFWRCDGHYWMTARNGHTIQPRRHLMMSNSLVELDNQRPGEWFEELCHAGMPHHITIFTGHNAEQFKRIARVLKMQFV